jgi:hypothetical protein
MKASLSPARALVVGLWLFCIVCAGASEWKSEELNCAITFPDGWNEVQLPETKVAVQNEDKTKTIFVIIQDVPRSVTVNDAFIVGARLAFIRRGGVIISENHPAIDQLPGLEIVGRVSLKGNDVSMKADTVITDGRLYRLEAMDVRRNVLEDQEMNQCLASFRFLHRPASPQEKSGAYRLGYMVGRYSAIAAVIIALVALGVVTIVRSASRRRSNPPPLPPQAA